MKIGTRILLVDDEPALLGVLRRIIEKQLPDATIVYASDVATAEWQLKSTDIAFVLTDLRMKADEHAGLRVIEAAKAAGVAVAVMTGGHDPVLADLAKASVEVLRKEELNTQRIAALLERVLPSGSSTA